jgi:Glycogen recognition site of AMP-activated protein kinase
MSKQENAPRDDGPVPGLSLLRETDSPPSLVPSVMRRIAEPRPPSLWAWLRRPRRLELRISLLGAAGVATVGGLALVLMAGTWPPRHGRQAISVEVPRAAGEPGAVVVRFTLVATGARKVAVAGDFNGWDPQGTPLLDQDGRGSFAGTVRLAPGAHEYMFVVDGEWVTDPAAAERRPDGFGRDNAVLRL